MTGAYSAAVFIIIPVDNVMAAVFNAPMTTVGGKNTLGVGLLGALTGDAIAEIAGRSTAFFVRELAFYDKSLSDMRKAKIAI